MEETGIPDDVDDQHAHHYLSDIITLTDEGDVQSHGCNIETHGEMLYIPDNHAYELVVALLVVPSENKAFTLEVKHHAYSSGGDVHVTPAENYYEWKADATDDADIKSIPAGSKTVNSTGHLGATAE